MTKKFEVRKGKFGKYDEITLYNTTTGEFVTVLPELGGNLHALKLCSNSTLHEILDGCRNPDDLEPNRHFRGAKLSPFTGRIAGGRYTFDKKEYQLPLNCETGRHALHGFVHNRNLVVLLAESDNERALLRLQLHHPGDATGYPFCFRLTLDYVLALSGLTCKTRFENLHHHPIPMADGWHPYFRTGSEVGKLELRVSAELQTELGADLLPTGRTVRNTAFLQPHRIGGTDLDLGLCLNRNGDNAVSELYDPTQNVNIQVWQQTGKDKYNYLQIYTPPDRQSVAIEPVTSNINSFNNGEGLVILAPNEHFEASFGVRLKTGSPTSN